MQKQTVRAYGILIAVLAIGGFFIKDGHLFGLMNADKLLDGLRALLAVFLLYVGFKASSAGMLKTSLLLVGYLYLGLALLGVIDSKLWGALPNGLTGFDIAFHIITGAAALGVAYRHGSNRAAAHA